MTIVLLVVAYLAIGCLFAALWMQFGPDGDFAELIIFSAPIAWPITLVVLAFCGLMLGLVWGSIGLARLPARLRALFRRNRTACDGVDWEDTGRGKIAHLCPTFVTAKQAHRVAEVEEGEFGGGTAMLAVYCARHCPGDCNNRRCHLARKRLNAAELGYLAPANTPEPDLSHLGVRRVSWTEAGFVDDRF